MTLLSAEIIKLLNNKDEASFKVMFQLYYPRLVYFAKEYVHYEDAREIVQDAFVTFLEKSPTFSNDFQVRSYLYTLVKNNCLIHLRHQKVKNNFVNKTNEDHVQNQVYQFALEQLDTSEFTFKEIEQIIKDTIESLPPRCREIFILSRINNKKNREIADDLNISIKSVEAQITNALKIFRVALKDFLPFIIFIF